MCGTVNHLSDDEQFDLASDLAHLASRLDDARVHLPKPYRDDALEVVEALHRRAAELGGDRACEIYGNEEEELHL
ncbi:MAG: hypothetical protein HY849_06480 [Nitrosomonadales bacterium]|nr:hypothetical protein [Nitrosomonadales bacterium]